MAKSKYKSELEEIKELAENDLWTFARLVGPERCYGDVHKRVFRWLQNVECPNSLLLLPRAHMKSHCIAVWCAWYVTCNPETSILYVSATSTLAEAQLYAIKQLMTSPIYQQYWPEMVHEDEGKREKWSTTAISVDHPKRKEEGIRDHTIVTAGLTTNTTGLHAEVIVADDVVVPDNAYTEEGRRKVSAAMSQMASILNTGGIVRACGTRYHPNDIYQEWKSQEVEVFDEHDEPTGEYEPIWDIMEEVVEINNKFLWPRAARDDGKKFGFDKKELARISAMYSDRTQFYAQYYNDPNDKESNRLTHDRFQYYEPHHLRQVGGRWTYRGKPLAIYAGIDFAFSMNKKADFTAIAVVGMCPDGHIFVLELDRFKTDKIATYFEHVDRLHRKWGFRKLRAEVTAAQSIIAQDLKDRMRKEGLPLSIDEHRPNRAQGSKEERIAAVLEPRYENLSMWHYKGGHTPALEDELVLARPQHDDLKDCLAFTVEIAKPASRRTGEAKQNVFQINRRFGGVAF